MTPIGIDTSVIIGLLDSRDLWHPAAIHLQQAIQAAGWEPVYFDCALAEAIGTVDRAGLPRAEYSSIGQL